MSTTFMPSNTLVVIHSELAPERTRTTLRITKLWFWGGPFIRAVIISRIRRRQFRHLIIFDMAVFDFVHILSADFHAAVLRNNQHTAFHVLVPDRSGIAQAPHSPVHEVEIHKTRIFKSRESGMVEIGKASLNIADIPEKPVHNVDEMGELGEKRPPSKAASPCQPPGL